MQAQGGASKRLQQRARAELRLAVNALQDHHLVVHLRTARGRARVRHLHDVGACVWRHANVDHLQGRSAMKLRWARSGYK